MATSKHRSVEYSDGRGLIEYTTENAEVFIGFTRVEEKENKINFWKNDFYQGSLQTETNRLFYGNDEVDFSVDVPQEFVDEVQSEVVDE